MKITFSNYIPVVFFGALSYLGVPNLSIAQEANKEATESTSYRAYADMSSCKPIWPKASLRNKETGAVTMEFLVSADGTVLDSKIVRSSGFRDLDNAAHVGLRACTFHAATENGKTVESWIKLKYVWKIE